MLKCCQDTLKLMQEIDGIGDILLFYLKASPYAVLVPELSAGLLSEGVKETIKGQIQDMAIERALGKVTGTENLPDVQDAIKAANEIIVRRLQGFAQIHSLPNSATRYHTGKETQLWNKLIAFYDPAKAAGGGSWWNPFG